MSRPERRLCVVLFGYWVFSAGLPAQAITSGVLSVPDVRSTAGTLSVDSFNDVAVGVELASRPSRTADRIPYQATSGPLSDFFTSSDGGADVWPTTNVGTDAISLTGFSQAVRSVGAYTFAVDLAGYPTPVSSLVVAATDSSGKVAIALPAPSTRSFGGFASELGINDIKCADAGQPNASVTINHVTIGQISTVPELSVGTLSLAGLSARRVAA